MKNSAVLLILSGTLIGAGLYVAANWNRMEVAELFTTIGATGPGSQADALTIASPQRTDRLGQTPSPLLAQYIPPAGGGQPSPAPAPVAGTQAGQPKQSGQTVDETALRYFARKGDTRRLEAEIARLRALYPDWQPPADPLAVPDSGDPQLEEMWKLYSEGKFSQLRKAIADRKTADANWIVPSDLLARLDIAEGRERLVNASDLKQYDTVIRVAADLPSLLTCADVDVMWRLAEAFAGRNNPDRARDAYLYILRNCDNAAERKATMQKAMPLLPRSAITELLATERTGADGAGEFAQERTDLLRRSVGEAGRDASAKVEPGDVQGLEEVARRDGLASDDLLLGWFHLTHGNAAAAAEWFSAARAKDDTAEASEGYGLALIALDRPAEAEEVLYKWQDGSDEIRKPYLAAVASMLAVEPRLELPVQVLQRVVPVVVATKDAAAAQQLGWYARAFDQHPTSRKWFATALGWKPDDEASAYGLALSLWQLGDREGVEKLQHDWAGRSERIARLGDDRPETKKPAPGMAGPINAGSGTQEHIGGAARGPAESRTQAAERNTPATSSRKRGCASTASAPANADDALMRGWCLMDKNRPVEAAIAFEAALASSNKTVRQDAAWGQSLAYLRSGLTDAAAVAAAKAPQPGARRNELEAAILSQRATSFFEARRYAETLLALDQRARVASERRDLMTLRGYAYLGLRRIGDARQVFRALADAGDREGARGLAAVEEALRSE